ncbi:hypothetical protein [Roseivirga sp.]|uniref:hypothetical protein n=1 Tax=Roseivirga sp. TaxID=1964215 RepID=UPI003B8E44B7
MFIERRFFKWNENDNNMPVRLGDNIYSLLENGIIVKDQKGNQDYRLEGNNDIWIGSKDDLVHFIYFCNHSGDELLCLDPFDCKYPATRPITG